METSIDNLGEIGGPVADFFAAKTTDELNVYDSYLDLSLVSIPVFFKTPGAPLFLLHFAWIGCVIKTLFPPLFFSLSLYFRLLMTYLSPCPHATLTVELSISLLYLL